MAYHYAIKDSTDPSTQNGAIIVNNNEIISGDANRFPKGVVETPLRWERPLKYAFVEHAERSVIYQAARLGKSTEGGTMYCCWAACENCARAIIDSGIKELVCHHDPREKFRFGNPASKLWLDSIAISFEMFKESGINVRWIEDKVFPHNDSMIRFNGNMVSP